MADKASRRGVVDLGVILMVAAFVVIGFFLYWLRGQARAELAVRIVEDTASVSGGANDAGAGGATTITPADIQAGAGNFTGQTVRLAGIGVAGGLGRQGFWLDLPAGPFLVSLSPSMIADSTVVTPGTTVTVTGTMMVMSDSVTATWLSAGHIGEGDQLAASFASHFIEASRVETGPGGGN